MDNSIKTTCADLSVGFLEEMVKSERTGLDEEILKQAGANGDKFGLSCDELERLQLPDHWDTGTFDKWTAVDIYLKRRETNYRLGTKWLYDSPFSEHFCRSLYFRLPADESPLQWNAIVHGALTCSFKDIRKSEVCRPFVLTNGTGEVEERAADILADELINFKELPHHFRIDALRLISRQATKRNVEKITRALFPILQKHNEPDPLARRHVLWSLGEIASQIYHPKVIETLLEKIDPRKESDAEVRATAIAAVSRASPKALDQPLIPETLKGYLDPQKEKNPLIRREIVMALGKLALKNNGSLSSTSLPNSLDPAKEPDPYVREAVLMTLWQNALQTGDTTYRNRLEKSNDPNWEPNVWVRRVAQSAVNGFKEDKKAPIQLFEILQYLNIHHELRSEKRKEAIQELVDLSAGNSLAANAVISTLLRTLDEKWEGNPEIRSESITALGKMGKEAIEETVIAKLLDYYRHGNKAHDFRDSAIISLTKLGSALISQEEKAVFTKKKEEMIKSFEEVGIGLESYEDGLLSEFAFSLGYLKEEIPKDKLQKVGLREVLLNILGNKAKPISFARLESLRALVKFEERDDLFFKALMKSLDPYQEYSEEVRLLAAENLLPFAHTQNAVQLAKILHKSLRTEYEPSNAVASAVMKTISEITEVKQLSIGTKKQLAGILLNIVGDREQITSMNRASALNALGSLKDHVRNLKAQLLKWIQPEYEGDEDVRLEAMKQLATFAPELDVKKAIPLLLARLDEKNEPQQKVAIAAMEVLKKIGEPAAGEKEVLQKLEKIARKEIPFVGFSDDDKALMEANLEKKMAAWDTLEVLRSYLPDPYANVPPLDEYAVLQSGEFKKLENGLALLIQYRKEGVPPPAGLIEEIRNLRDRDGSIGRAFHESGDKRFQRAKELYALHVLDLPWFDEELKRLIVKGGDWSKIVEHQIHVLATQYEPSVADVGISYLQALKEKTLLRVAEEQKEDVPLWAKIHFSQK